MSENPSVGDLLNHSRILAGLLALMGVVYIVWHFYTKGFSIDINVVNFIFLIAGILLHGNISNYLRAVKSAVGGVSGVIFQFPLYAGIMGMVQYSGLVDILASGMVSISNASTFYLMTFLSSSVVNLFVPSGGGQWTVQGPIAIQSAKMMDANIIKTCLAVAYGNTWTNMFQPFWAIALLGITGLKAKDIMGYSTAIMLLSAPIFILCTLFLPV
jgi:short-chain fatty acids transporter